MKWYFYLHIDGDVIGKNPIVVDEGYFDSPFVKKFWFVETSGDFIKFINEAKNLGANRNKLDRLIEEQGLNKDDVYKEGYDAE